MHSKKGGGFLILLLGLFVVLLLPSSAFAQDICPNDSPRSIAVGDFDGDGNLDIARVQQGSSNVLIYTGNGSGGLGGPTSTPTGILRPTSVVAGDFTGDANLDLAVAGFTQPGPLTRAGVVILEGDGAGSFQQASQVFDLGSTATIFGASPTVTAGDFIAGGKQELAVVNANNRVFILRETGNGFALSDPFSVLTGPNDVAAGNFNTNVDQHLDLAVANRFQGPGQVTVRLGDGAGGLPDTGRSDIATGGIGPQAVVTGKFNNDNHLDLAVVHFGSNDVTLLQGNGAGGFTQLGSPISLPSEGNGSSLVALDFNGDGKLDLAAATYASSVADNNIFVLLGNGQGGFPTKLNLQVQEGFPPFPPSSIVAADFNGDGLPDLAASFFCSGQVQILINPFPPPVKAMVYVTNREDDTVSVIDPAINQVIDTVPVGHKPHGITLTPDGKEAYVANRNDDNVSVITTGTTAGSNTQILTIPVGQHPEGIGAANVPTKGAKVFVANRNDDTISVINAVPSSPFFHTVISTVNLPKPKSQKPVAVAFSSDGAFAYVVAEESHKLFVIDAKKAIDDPANAVLHSVAVGKHPKAVDVSNDGKRIYVANRGDSTVSKLTTEAPGSPASPQVIATIKVAEHPEGVAVLPDGTKVYVTNREENKVTVIDANTNGTTTISVGRHPLGIDIIPAGGFAYVAEEGDNAVAVIATSSNSVVATIPVGKHPRGVAAGAVPITAP